MSAPTKSTWRIELTFTEDRDHTQALATLYASGDRQLHGRGRATRNPADRPAPLIGEEIAGARALSDLAHELLEAAAAEIEVNVHRDDPRV
jgi:hypothetical protein